MFIHYMYADILFPLTKANPIIFERVTTHYQTLRIWIGHDAWRYHNLSALPYALPYALPRVLLKPPTTDQPTHRPLTTYPPTHQLAIINLHENRDQNLNIKTFIIIYRLSKEII